MSQVFGDADMKHTKDAILRPEQADYLDALHGTSVQALAALAGTTAVHGRDPLLSKMEARAAERRYPISDPEVAVFLSLVARIAQPKLIVELGTNIGYGAIVLARAAGPDARVVTVEVSSELVEEARAYIAEAGLAGRIDVRHGLALAELEKLADPIDLLYIDCVKEEYPLYLEAALPKLAPRGVVVADNALWSGEVAREVPRESEKERARALRAFNLALVSHPGLCSVILPLGDGVGIAVRV
jgi:predicted O-methyltransferase YrrM